MKVLSYLVFLYAFIIYESFSQEYEINYNWKFPLPQGNDWNDFEILNDNNIIFSGIQGALYKMSSKNEFTQLNNRNFKNINMVRFIDSLKGFIVVDNNKIYGTFDKGNNWFLVESFQDLTIKKFDFLDDKIGFIIFEDSQGDSDVLYYTSNSGLDWSKTYLNEFFEEIDEWDVFSDFYIEDENTIYFSTYDYIFKSTNKGLNWNRIESNLLSYDKIYLSNNNKGYAISNLLPYKTEDGGQTWTELELPKDWEYAYDIKVLDENTIFLLRDYGYMFASNDGGSSWKSVYIPGIDSIYDEIKKIHFFDSNNGILIAGTHIATTSNGGMNWEVIKKTKEYETINFSFFNDKLGFMTDLDNVLYKSTDGGDNWVSLKKYEDFRTFSYFGVDIRFIHPINETNLWAFDIENRIAYSTNGGSSWNINNDFYMPAFPMFTKIKFFGTTHGWIVGRNGTVIYTTDGGKKWISKEFDTKNYFVDLDVVNENYAWALDELGKVFYTTNGGSVWENRSIDQASKDKFKTIQFTSIKDGRAISSSAYYTTQNGGGSWKKFDFKKLGYQIVSMSFNDLDNGVVAAYKSDPPYTSTLFITTNNGETWDIIEKDFPTTYIYYKQDNSIINYGVKKLINITLNKLNSIQNPDFISPIKNSKKNEQNIEIEWNKVTNHGYYHIQISEDQEFNNILYDEYLVNTFIDFKDLKENTTYFLRIRIQDWDMNTSWSTPISFKTKINSPTLLSPNNNDEKTTNTVELRWSKAITNNYILQLSRNSNFSQIELEELLSDTIYYAKPERNNSVYYWRVMAVQDDDSSSWSNFRTFRTKFDNTNVKEINNSKFISFNHSEKYLVIKDDSDFYNPLQIFDLQGNLIQSEIIQSKNQIINLQRFINGVYFVKYRNEQFILLFNN